MPEASSPLRGTASRAIRLGSEAGVKDAGQIGQVRTQRPLLHRVAAQQAAHRPTPPALRQLGERTLRRLAGRDQPGSRRSPERGDAAGLSKPACVARRGREHARRQARCPCSSASLEASVDEGFGPRLHRARPAAPRARRERARWPNRRRRPTSATRPGSCPCAWSTTPAARAAPVARATSARSPQLSCLGRSALDVVGHPVGADRGGRVDHPALAQQHALLRSAGLPCGAPRAVDARLAAGAAAG